MTEQIQSIKHKNNPEGHIKGKQKNRTGTQNSEVRRLESDELMGGGVMSEEGARLCMYTLVMFVGSVTTR